MRVRARESEVMRWQGFRSFVSIFFITIIYIVVASDGVAYALLTARSTIHSTGKIVSGEVYYYLDFETGSLPVEFIHEDRPNGATCDIVSDIVREGNYAFKATNTDPSVANRAQITCISLRGQGIKEGYYGFSVYIPTDFRAATTYMIPFQIIQRTGVEGNYDYRVIMALKFRRHSNQPPDYPPHIQLYSNSQGESTVLWEGGEVLPRGQWIDFLVYLDVDIEGRLTLWRDGVLIADVSYDSRAYSDSPDPYPCIGCYQSVDGFPNWMVFDQMVIASTYEECISNMHAGE